MKNFFAVLLAWLFVIAIFGFLLAGLLFSNIWTSLLFLAFLFTVPTLIFVGQDEKIEALEARIATLENKNKEQNDD